MCDCCMAGRSPLCCICGSGEKGDPCPPGKDCLCNSGKTCSWCGHTSNPDCGPVAMAGADGEDQAYGSDTLSYGDDAQAEPVAYGDDALTYDSETQAEPVAYGGEAPA